MRESGVAMHCAAVAVPCRGHTSSASMSSGEALSCSSKRAACASTCLYCCSPSSATCVVPRYVDRVLGLPGAQLQEQTRSQDCRILQPEQNVPCDMSDVPERLGRFRCKWTATSYLQPAESKLLRIILSQYTALAASARDEKEGAA